MTNREQLLAVKLATLVREHCRLPKGSASVALQPGEFGGGAALMIDDTVWVLLDDRPERGLGPAVAWALRQNATGVNILAEHAAGSAAEVIPVVNIDDRTIGDGKPGPITRALQKAYFDVTYGRVADHPEWRSPVWQGA